MVSTATAASTRPARSRLAPTALMTDLSAMPALLPASIFTLVSAIATGVVVSGYYETHLPHFDSIGAYTTGYQIMNAATQQGLLAGVVTAAQISLSWLQPFYALLWAWTPWHQPAVLVSLNFVLLLITQAAIADWARLHGCGWHRQLVLMVLPTVPGALYAWDGGYQDWRRDAQMNLLLIGLLFLGLSYVTRPAWRRGVALGAVAGLTQLSRDNALSLTILVLLPVGCMALSETVRRRSPRYLLELVGVPLAVFLMLAVPYYVMTLGTTISRYLYLVWGPGEGRLRSLAQFWSSPFAVLFGGTRAFNGKPPVGVAMEWCILAVAVVIVVAALLRVVAIRPRRLVHGRGRLLLGAGVTTTAAVVLYTTLGLGYGAEYSGAPFVATVPGLVAILAGLSEMVVQADTTRARQLASVLVLLGVCALIPFNLYRMQAGQFDAVGPAAVAAARQASVHVADLAQGRPVAVFWLQDFSAFTMSYYLTQAGQAPLVRIDAGDVRLAISRPIPAGESPQVWLERLRAETSRRAAVIVVNENTKRYADPTMPSGLFHDGEPIIRALLDDPQFEAVEHFQVGPNRFVMLARRATS